MKLHLQLDVDVKEYNIDPRHDCSDSIFVGYNGKTEIGTKMQITEKYFRNSLIITSN